MNIEMLGETVLFRTMTEEEILLCLKELRSQEMPDELTEFTLES